MARARPVSSLLALAAGLLAVGVPLPLRPTAAAPGLLGLALLALALRLGDRRLLGAGLAGLFAVSLLAGFLGVGAAPLVVSAAAALVATEFARTAIRLGETLEPDARSARAERYRGAAAVCVAVVGAVVAVLVAGVDGVVVPSVGHVLLFVGAVALLLAFR